MVDRVSNQARQASALNNVFRLSEDIFANQTALSTGKKVQRPSDDPAGTRETLALRTTLRQTEQFIRNMSDIRNFVSQSETVLNNVSGVLIRAKELAVNQLSGTANAQTRKFAVSEVNNLIAEVLQTGNTKIDTRFAFGGSQVTTQPFQESASGAIYLGNTEDITIEIGNKMNVVINIPGSDVLATDLNPNLALTTAVTDLNRGAGISPGSFTISDRAGNTGTVTINNSMTIGDVISAIDSAGTSITASINSAQNGLRLTDSTPIITQALSVTELGSGSTASSLGILGQRNGDSIGLDLDPRVSNSTLISDLNGGEGLTLSSINLVNGGASGAISFDSATTVGDVLNRINNAGFNVTAGISSQGNALRVISNDSTTTAIVREVGTGKTGQQLGLGGGRNVLTTLIQFKEALNRDDTSALQAVLENLDTGLESLGESRAISGSILRRVDDNQFVLDQSIVDQTNQLSNIEDIDFAKKASELASLELAFQATLNTTARILQPSILDFLA
ncbi:MAG: flagellar hook-associated protein FlgL [Nitrospinota bacterium]|nr:flagellar hook-associated protein FlgL [Nitrospinota bacterium]